MDIESRIRARVEHRAMAREAELMMDDANRQLAFALSSLKKHVEKMELDGSIGDTAEKLEALQERVDWLKAEARSIRELQDIIIMG